MVWRTSGPWLRKCSKTQLIRWIGVVGREAAARDCVILDWTCPQKSEERAERDYIQALRLEDLALVAREAPASLCVSVVHWL